MNNFKRRICIISFLILFITVPFSYLNGITFDTNFEGDQTLNIPDSSSGNGNCSVGFCNSCFSIVPVSCDYISYKQSTDPLFYDLLNFSIELGFTNCIGKWLVYTKENRTLLGFMGLRTDIDYTNSISLISFENSSLNTILMNFTFPEETNSTIITLFNRESGIKLCDDSILTSWGTFESEENLDWELFKYCQHLAKFLNFRFLEYRLYLEGFAIIDKISLDEAELIENLRDPDLYNYLVELGYDNFILANKTTFRNNISIIFGAFLNSENQSIFLIDSVNNSFIMNFTFTEETNSTIMTIFNRNIGAVFNLSSFEILETWGSVFQSCDYWRCYWGCIMDWLYGPWGVVCLLAIGIICDICLATVLSPEPFSKAACVACGVALAVCLAVPFITCSIDCTIDPCSHGHVCYPDTVINKHCTDFSDGYYHTLVWTQCNDIGMEWVVHYDYCSTRHQVCDPNSLTCVTDPRPVASAISLSGTSVLESDIVFFSSTGSYDEDGIIVSYNWNFGDGTSSTDPNPSHVYSRYGTYTVTLVVTDNDDNTGTASLTMTVSDDDITPPVINYIYTGDGTDGNSGEIIVTASDDSGLSVDPSGTYPVPNSLGTHSFTFIAIDNDNDNPDDTLSSTLTIEINIQDDDTTAPFILISYSGGDGMDGNPGYFSWEITDMDNGIGGDHDTGFSEIEIRVDYISTEGLPDEEFILPSTETGSWNLPQYLGYYTITISATDNDDDRTLTIDSLTTVLSSSQEINDDDINPPEVSNLIITDDIHYVSISLDAIDTQSGIGEIQILVEGESIEPIYQTQIENTYFFTLENQWILKNDIYDVEVRVSDADNDRPNDILTTSIFGIFEITLDEMYEYVIWQLEELKNYIDENVCDRLSQSLNRKLTQAQDHLYEGFNYVANDEITCGLFHNYIAKIYVQIAEHKTKIFNRIGRINDTHAEYIMDSLHDIRNNVVILKGASVGTEQAYNIALIEIQLLDLQDFIEEEIQCCVGICLSYMISHSAGLLELALFKISMGYNIEWILEYTQCKLERTISKINSFLERGRISEDVANYLIERLSKIIEDIAIIS